MKVGIIGEGIVATALQEGFVKLGHEVAAHEGRVATIPSHLLDTEILFLCTRTSTGYGTIDITHLENEVAELSRQNYQGVIAIKSPVPPGTIGRCTILFPELRLCYVPTFLRERYALTDFIDNHPLCVIGTDDGEIFTTVKYCHGNLPQRIMQTSIIEAEFFKHFHDAFNTTVDIFVKSSFEVCRSLGIDYSKMKQALVLRRPADISELKELPKDTRALASLASTLVPQVSNLRSSVERSIESRPSNNLSTTRETHIIELTHELMIPPEQDEIAAFERPIGAGRILT